MSYGGVAKRWSPLPQVSDARWAAVTQELSDEATELECPFNCCFAQGIPYFHTTTASMMMTTHLISRLASMPRSYAVILHGVLVFVVHPPRFSRRVRSCLCRFSLSS